MKSWVSFRGKKWVLEDWFELIYDEQMLWVHAPQKGGWQW